MEANERRKVTEGAKSTAPPIGRDGRLERMLYEKPKPGNGTCRHGYGREVFELRGTRCAYCDRELGGSYESWLDLSVDHVIPQSYAKNLPKEGKDSWIGSKANLVPCCRACNEFLNKFAVKEKAPTSPAEFLQLYKLVFARKREQAERRHQEEKRFYEKWRKENATTPR